MLFEDLPSELLGEVYTSCGSVADVVNLSLTCRRLRGVFNSSRKLHILQSACDANYGPMEDAVQLVTHNASQPTHIIRCVPLSEALLKQVIDVGRVAKQWEDIYPFKKWKDTFEERRLLTNSERRRFRRALYRLWLYGSAYHNIAFPRYSRSQPLVNQRRALLLHNWSNAELAEIEDVRRILRDVLRHNICPSNGTIQRKFRKRFPDTNHQLLFNVHLNYPPPPSAAMQQLSIYHHRQMPSREHAYGKYQPSAWHEPGLEGWGDDVQHYYIVEDMLKLDPRQILWLKDNAPLKSQVERYVKGMGEWFDNNGETFGQTLESVLYARGEDVEEFKLDLDDLVLGVVSVDGDDE